MKIKLTVERNPAEYSSHLRVELYWLFRKLGFKVVIDSDNNREWTQLEAFGDAPDERLLPTVFKLLE
jgi:hypothetical protein